MRALLPLLVCSLMMGVVAVVFLAWYAVVVRRSTGTRSEVAKLRDGIADLQQQQPPPPSDAASRRAD